jgi:hypothetical protein
MKHLIILSLLLTPFFVKGQTEYNIRGDAAKERKDYQTAMFWYEEGVSVCNRHSIDQLTAIWKEDADMHASMQVAMGKCLDCLINLATNNKDTLAIIQLIDYYSEGIGTVKSEVTANFWKEQIELIRNPITVSSTPKEPMKFFLGYHASLIKAPFGFQVGGMGKSVGWYVRFRSNFTFQPSQYVCEVINDHLHIEELNKDDIMYRPTTNIKETWLTGSAGIMFKVVPNIAVSAGIGYWDRKYQREFVKVDDKGKEIPGSSGWARDKHRSMDGFSVDLDGSYLFNGKIYGSLGVSSLNFKYVYPNVGVGFYF